MECVVIRRKVRAILKFGPAASTDGCRGGEFYEAIIDPNMVSPGGEFIRFDQRFQCGEIHGWQRVHHMTICEILGDVDDYPAPPPEGAYRAVDGAEVMMMQASYGE